MKKGEVIRAYGHKIIRSAHRTILEITRDKPLTERGHYIIAENADKGAADLSTDFKQDARRSDTITAITLDAGGVRETIKSKGDPRFCFTDHNDMALRKSSYMCGRTIAVGADKAGFDLSRRLVERLQNPYRTIGIVLRVEALDASKV